MPRGSRYTVAKSAPRGKVKKGRRKRRAARHPVVPSKRISPPRGIPAAPSVQQIAPPPYVLPDLKRIGIIAVAMFLLLIILSLVL